MTSNYSESATIKTPEVGDIWKKNGSKHKFVITNLGTADNPWISRVWDNGFADSFPPTTHLDYYHTYVGKAKGSISDLFEVQDD